MSETEAPANNVPAEDCSSQTVMGKYRVAGDIAQTALQGVIEQCVPGKKAYDLCRFGDAIISQRCAGIYKSNHVEKGIAFPTCVSVNELICHYSPYEEDSVVLKAGDWVKIDLGCHIDGYIAVTARTHIVQVKEADQEPEKLTLTDEKANVFQCAYEAAQICARLIKPGNTNTMVTEAMEKIAAVYGVTPIYGTVMHQLKRFIIDANKMIALKKDPVSKFPEITFEKNEVYAVDVCFTTGQEKSLESDARMTVYKRQVDKTYQLKLRASRAVLGEVNKRFPTLPFSLHSFENVKQARMGIVECVKHGLMQGYPILEGRSDDAIVHFKMTIALTSTGTVEITSIALPEGSIQPSKKLEDEELLQVLNTPLKPKNPKKSKAKKKTATAEDSTK